MEILEYSCVAQRCVLKTLGIFIYAIFLGRLSTGIQKQREKKVLYEIHESKYRLIALVFDAMSV